jgi:hypothetical protein
MKRIFLSILFLSLTFIGYSQNCDNLVGDLLNGTLNGVKPTDDMALVKAKLPCFTGDSDEGVEMNCSGGVFYIKHNFFCYTGRDYIEMRRKFTGKLSIPIFGLTKDAAIKKLGLGKEICTVVRKRMRKVMEIKEHFYFLIQVMDASYCCLRTTR